MVLLFEEHLYRFWSSDWLSAKKPKLNLQIQLYFSKKIFYFNYSVEAEHFRYILNELIANCC